MVKTLILSLLLLCATSEAQPYTEVVQADINNGGLVSHMMENLGGHTANVTSELLAQLLANIERAANALVSRMEIISSSALNQLSQPIEDFQIAISSSSQCQPLITLEQLKQQIDSDLAQCTQDLQDILKTIYTTTNDLKVALEKNIKDIIDLPKKCKTEEGFGITIRCYTDNITEFNKQIAIIVNNARETMEHAQQLGAHAVQEARECASDVIASTKENLDKILATCQLTVQENN